MICVGLTGSIGSGKSYVASLFEKMGIPVFHADAVSREQLGNSEVKEVLVRHFGAEILAATGEIDRKVLAGRVFTDDAELKFLNTILHPKVKELFDEWLREQSSPYIIHEAAILYESGFDRYFDKIIAVIAPRDVCISRVITRDGVKPEQVEERMLHQWQPEKVADLADYVITNDGDTPVVPQVMEIHRQLLAGQFNVRS